MHSLQAKGGLAENLGWVPRPAFADLIWFFVELTGFAEFPRIGVPAMVCVLIFLALIYRRRTGLNWLTVLCIVPAPLVFLVTQYLRQSIWGHRHLVFTLWPFLVVFADTVWRQRAAVRVAVMTLAGVWAVFAAAQHATDDRKLSWDVLTLQMLDTEQSGAPHIPFYAVDDFIRYPIWFYLDCLKNGWLGPFGPRRPPGHSALAEKAARVETIQIRSLYEARGDYFWVGYSDTSWHEARSPRQVFEDRGCAAGPELTGRYQFHRVFLFAVKCPK